MTHSCPKKYNDGGNNPMYGHKHSEESRMKMSLAQNGHVFHGKRKHSEETKKKLSENRLGENNPLWRGSDVGYGALHAWVRRRLPMPESCELCNLVPPYDLANVTGIYNRDFENWKYYCRKCHLKSDGRLYNNLKNQRGLQ